MDKRKFDEITVDCIKNGFRKAGIYNYETAESESRDPFNESTDEEAEETASEESLSNEDVSAALIDIRKSFETDFDEKFEGFE
jgi:hypothetical protein